MSSFVGLNGTMDLLGDCVLLKKGKAFGNYEKNIYLRDIIEVQLKKPGLSRPMIAIVNAADGNGGGVLNYTSPQSNVLIFKAKEWDEAVQFKRSIDEAVSRAKGGGAGGGGVSEADELAKFKKLLDDGVITAAEFEAKKKQILGI